MHWGPQTPIQVTMQKNHFCFVFKRAGGSYKCNVFRQLLTIDMCVYMYVLVLCVCACAVRVCYVRV